MWRAKASDMPTVTAKAKQWSVNKVATTTTRLNELRGDAKKAKLTLRQTVWVDGVQGVLPQLEGGSTIKAYVMVRDEEGVQLG